MAKVLMTRPIPGPAAEMIKQAGHELTVNPNDVLYSPEELIENVKGYEGILTQLGDVMSEEVIKAAGEQLKVISNFAVGYNNIDVAAATARGVRVANTPGVLTEATADIAWALLMGVSRRLAEGDQMVRSGGFDGWTPTMLLGTEIVGKTLLIVGAGRIGYAVGRRAKAWNMRILYVARSVHRDFEDELGAERVELETGLGEADFVSLHTPLTPETHHLMNAERLGMMKRGAYLINTARGAVVDEKALIEALNGGLIAGAGLDVYENEPELEPGLSDCRNTMLLPHLGSATVETRDKMSEIAAENLLRVLEGKDPLHGVN